MANRPSNPGDPEVVERVVQLIHQMLDEELLQRLRARPDFDETWIQQTTEPSGRSVQLAATVSAQGCLPVIKRSSY